MSVQFIAAPWDDDETMCITACSQCGLLGMCPRTGLDEAANLHLRAEHDSIVVIPVQSTEP